MMEEFNLRENIIYSHITMKDNSPYYPKKKTYTFAIHANKGGTLLGWIVWSGKWRQYVMETITSYPCIFSRSCNLDINNFIDKLMEERK